jgi:hypothetical protein
VAVASNYLRRDDCTAAILRQLSTAGIPSTGTVCPPTIPCTFLYSRPPITTHTWFASGYRRRSRRLPVVVDVLDTTAHVRCPPGYVCVTRVVSSPLPPGVGCLRYLRVLLLAVSNVLGVAPIGLGHPSSCGLPPCTPLFKWVSFLLFVVVVRPFAFEGSWLLAAGVA